MSTRKLGVALLAAVASLLVVAAVGQAAKFKAGTYPATVEVSQGGEEAPPPPAGTGIGEGEARIILGFEGKLMTACTGSTFVGKLSEASSSLTVTPALSGCWAFGIINSTVTLNGCQYRFNAGSGSADAFTGTMDIVCPEGKKIAVVGGTCEVQIGAQTGLTTVSYANLTEEEPDAATVGFSIAGLAYTKTKDGFLCSLVGTGAKTDGVIVGGGTVVAKDSKESPTAFGLE